MKKIKTKSTISLFVFIARLISTFIRTAIISLIIAVLFGFMRYIGYLLSWVEKPTIENILGMAAILWGIMILRGLVSVFALVYHCYKDPCFKRAVFQTGISWKDYKRLKGN